MYIDKKGGNVTGQKNEINYALIFVWYRCEVDLPYNDQADAAGTQMRLQHHHWNQGVKAHVAQVLLIYFPFK